MIPQTIKDGFGIRILFGVGESGVDHSGLFLLIDPNSITPPGQDGLDNIDTTTHSNDDYRTKHERALLEVTDGSFTANYDPDEWPNILEAINDNCAITFLFPTGGSLTVYGYLKSFVPNAYEEGEDPTGEGVIVVTNWDHVEDEEEGPIQVASSDQSV